MIKAKALLVGLKEINPANYNRWNGRNGCAGCELDVENLQKILEPLNYNLKTLKTSQATAENILKELENAASILQQGDIFVFFYAGHGGQQPDENDDEPDGRDETLMAYDREIIDDELNKIWLKMKPGVRIVMISDSCNSGSNYRCRSKDFSNPSPIVPIPDQKTVEEMKAQMIHMGGCRDGFSSTGHPEGGEFTLALVKAWQQGGFEWNYQQLYEKTCDLITTHQKIQYTEYGPVTPEFRNQKPFSVEMDGRKTEKLKNKKPIKGGEK
ncbi:MAG: caspase family protein [Candidatus Aminicenantes bacterium]|jgi:hypothetical protein